MLGLSSSNEVFKIVHDYFSSDLDCNVVGISYFCV